MPVSPTYPGVYIEEIPSGVRTITGVATSITAFIGRAARGPVSEPTAIFNFGDFERQFGGLGVDYPMSYAVRDFFLNGGGEALIVRLFKPKNGTGAATATQDSLKLEAANPGIWSEKLTFNIDYEGIDELDGKAMEATALKQSTDDLSERYGLDVADLFNLTIKDTVTGATERINNVTFKDTARRVDRILKQLSSLARFQLPFPTSAPGRPGKVANKPFSGGNDGDKLDVVAYKGNRDEKTGLYALEKADLFNLLCIPADARDGDTDVGVYSDAMVYCVERRAMLIVDSPAAWESKKETAAADAKAGLSALGLTGPAARNAALYFPRVIQADDLREGQLETFVPCGIVAGVMARTDVTRGVWKAPAGLDASLNGIRGLSVNLTDPENGQLNPLGINCLRSFPVTGRVVWGARTLRGADILADDYKYIPVRRLALFIEESLYRGTQWVVFEPNDEPLWAQIRLNIGAFMHNLFRQGAFQGRSPREAYLVKVDSETTTQNDINLGIVNIVVGFAPLKPAEFVIIKIQQLAGQIDT